MKTKSIHKLACKGLSTIVMTAVASGAFAEPVQTPFGDPFPSDSFVIMTPTSTLSTAFGFVDTILLQNFSTNTPIDLGGDDYSYTDSTVQFVVNFLDAPGGNKVGSFIGDIDATGFVVVVYDRTPSFVEPGTFNIEMTEATFSGSVFDLNMNNVGNLTTQINPAAGFESTGTANFTGLVPTQFVDIAMNIAGQYSVNGDPFEDVPMTVVSSDAPTLLVELIDGSFVQTENSINWTTGMEEENAGFNLYCYQPESSTCAKLNNSLISTGDTLDYSYSLDQSSVSGCQIWLEDIDFDGKSTARGPAGADSYIVIEDAGALIENFCE